MRSILRPRNGELRTQKFKSHLLRTQSLNVLPLKPIVPISNKDHVTNEEVRAKIQQAIGPHEDLLTIVKRRKLQWYGHVSRASGLAKTILQGTAKGVKKTRQTEEEVGRQHQGMDRPGVRQVPEGSGEQGKMEETGCEIICGAPTTLAVKKLMMMIMRERACVCVGM